MNRPSSAGPNAPAHLLPDSERLLRAHNAWIASWDTSDQEEDEPDKEALLKEAYNLYADGYSPVEVRWRMAERHPLLPARHLSQAQRAAERALCASESAPAELRRAMVAASRQRAIQGALAGGDWGQALKGLERAGEIAGELRESAGLSDDDLVLTVTVEGSSHALSQAETGEPLPNLTVETGETEE